MPAATRQDMLHHAVCWTQLKLQPVLLQGAVDSLQEELLVRGALAENFCFYEVGNLMGNMLGSK